MECKNIECCNQIRANKVYCSRSCRSYYVNKYMRDYTKLSQTLLEKRQRDIDYYSKSPKLCLFCEKAIPFDKSKDNIFCDSSCSASYNNSCRSVSWGDKISDGLKLYHYNKEKTFLNLKLCLNCLSPFKRNKVFCSNSCKSNYYRGKMSDYAVYKSLCQFKFNLSDFPDEFDFSLVRENGWYSPKNKRDNLKGVSRDHMFSIREGFNLNVLPKIIAHPANCKLLIHSDNISKNKKCSLTLEELLDRIEMFDSRHKRI